MNNDDNDVAAAVDKDGSDVDSGDRPTDCIDDDYAMLIHVEICIALHTDQTDSTILRIFILILIFYY